MPRSWDDGRSWAAGARTSAGAIVTMTKMHAIF
jgi:hypothetical protein